MTKFIRLFLISTLLIVLLSGLSFAEDVTNLGFANVLITQLELTAQLPANYSSLPPADQFTTAANVLSSVGLTAFVGKNYNDVISVGDAADVLYRVLVVPAPGTAQVPRAERLNYLINRGIMSANVEAAPLTDVEGDSIVNNINEQYDLAGPLSTYAPRLREDLVTTSPSQPTGINLNMIRVDPDIVAPYTQRASPTI